MKVANVADQRRQAKSNHVVRQREVDDVARADSVSHATRCAGTACALHTVSEHLLRHHRLPMRPRCIHFQDRRKDRVQVVRRTVLPVEVAQALVHPRTPKV